MPSLVAGTALALAAATATGAEDRPRLEPARATEPPRIDGRLDDAVWRGPALALGDWVTYNPLSGETLPQRTEVRVAYDDRYLYFAFHCEDPEPAGVRGTLSRRDDLWNDDWVGLSLDSVGNGQSSYDLFVNPLGVQGDILNSASAGENTAPDFVWDSGGRLTEQGYDVEIRVPLTTVRFVSGPEVRMRVLFWRRVSRLGISVSWPEVPAGRSLLECHAAMQLGSLERPLTLELIPTATYSRRETRATPEGFGPARSDPDLGISFKYGLTSSATIEGTVNPDFSQVESDAFQVEVNQRFPLFFSEKRPFFMEGLGTFELAGVGGDAVMRTAVHTRRIVDPAWGAKTTGSAGRLGFGVLAAGDEAPGRQLGEEPNPFAGERKEFFVGRGQLELGPSSYVGALVADTELGSGHNRVAGADFSLRRGNHRASATFLATATRAPEGGAAASGLGGGVYYEYATRPLVLISQLEHYDRGFQMDTAFLSQVGITQGWLYLGPSFYPDAEKLPWLKRINPFVFARYGRDRIQGGDPWIVVPAIRFNLTRQGFVRIDTVFGEEPWLGQTYRISNTRIFAEAQLTRWLYVNARVGRGRSIFYDAVDPFPGRQRNYYAELRLQPSARLGQSLGFDRVEFDRADGGERVFTVNVLNSRTTFQLDRRFSLRGIVQYDSSRNRVLLDFLASWELLPGTVAYAGYGSSLERLEWDGESLRPGRGRYRAAERGFFFKASYIHRF
jgi:hypothetical protein